MRKVPIGLPLTAASESSPPIGIEDVGVVIPGDDGVVTVLTADGDVGEPRRDDELFLIYTFLDVDDLGVVHEGTAHLYGFVDGAELAGAVA